MGGTYLTLGEQRCVAVTTAIGRQLCFFLCDFWIDLLAEITQSDCFLHIISGNRGMQEGWAAQATNPCYCIDDEPLKG